MNSLIDKREKKVYINKIIEKMNEDIISIPTKKLINYLSLQYMLIIIKTNLHSEKILIEICPNELSCLNDEIYFNNEKIHEIFI